MKHLKKGFSKALTSFFRPNKLKVLIPIGITIIIVLAGIRGHYGYSERITLLGQFLFILYYPVILILEYVPFYIPSIALHVILVSLFYYYLLACIVVYLAKKIIDLTKNIK